MILKVAFRNIFRHKRRTILTLMTMIFGIFIAIFSRSFNEGMRLQLLDIYKNTDISNYMIYDKGYYEDKLTNNPMNFLIKNQNKIKSILGEAIYTDRILFPGTLIANDGEDEINIKILGVNINEENKVFKRDQAIVAGDFLVGNNEVVIGSGIASLLKLKKGSTITVQARREDNGINAIDYTIGGIIKTNNMLIDQYYIFMTKKQAEIFLGTKKINNISILSTLKENTINKLNNSGVEVIDLKEGAKDLLTIINLRRKIFNVISMGIVLMAAISIANTMLMAMLERRHEIGIVLANGMTGGDIMKQFIAEGTIIGILGSGLGLFFGYFLVVVLLKNGIPFPVDSAEMGIEFPIPTVLHLHFSFASSFVYFIIGVIVSSIASFYSSYKAAMLNPVEIMRD